MRDALADMTRPLPRFVAVVTVAPLLAGTLVVGLFAVLESMGRAPFSYPPPRNIAEAAGMGLPSEVLRFLHAGQNPHDVWPVRPDIISSSLTRVTALEAAVWSRRVELVRMLDREGTITDDAERQRLACVASAIALAPVEEYLAPGGVASCDPDATVGDIEARAK